MARPATLDHLRSRKKPVTGSVLIALDSEVAERFERAQLEHEMAKARLESAPPSRAESLQAAVEDAKDELDEARAAYEEETVEFKFRSIGKDPYEELANLHPPTKDQKEKAKAVGEKVNYNLETFPIALVSACCTQPEMSEAEVKELWNNHDWNQGELMSLFFKAVEVNQQRRIPDFPNA